MIRKALGLVLVVCIVTVLSSLIRGWLPHSSPMALAPSPEEVRQQVEKRQRDEQDKNMQVVTYAVIETLYKNMRDPDSFKLHSVYVLESSTVLVSCVEYYARNGFGGMNREYAVGTSTHGDFKFSANNATVWNKMCANKPGSDFKIYGEYSLKRIKILSN